MNTQSIGNIRYFYKGVKIDDRTREYIEKRLESLNKIADNILQIEVEVDLDKKGKFRVEIMVKTPRNLFRSENTTESIEGSTDMSIEELHIQIVGTKDKLRTLRDRGARSIKKKTVLDENSRF